MAVLLRAFGGRHLDAGGGAALHCLHFQRALCLLCLMRLRVTWTGRLLQWVRCVVSQVFACLLVLCLWPLARVFLLRLRTRYLVSQRGILSIRLSVWLLRGLLKFVLPLRLLSLTVLDLNSRCFLNLAVLLLLALLVVLSLALLRLTLLDVPFLMFLQFALLAGLRLALLHLALFLFALLLRLALTFQHRVRLERLFAL